MDKNASSAFVLGPIAIFQNITETLVPVRNPKIVAVKQEKIFPAQSVIDYVTPESEIEEKTCPSGYEKAETGLECVASEPQCPLSFQWKNNVCVKIVDVCPLDHDLYNKTCVPKIVCPLSYTLEGNQCVAPTPKCKSGWQWNGRICEVVMSYSKESLKKEEEKYEKIFYTCPTGFERNSTLYSCIRTPFTCPSGFVKDTNKCTRKVAEKCPVGSTKQNGKCAAIKLVCPSESKKNGSFCISEETVNVTHYEMWVYTAPIEMKLNPNLKIFAEHMCQIQKKMTLVKAPVWWK